MQLVCDKGRNVYIVLKLKAVCSLCVTRVAMLCRGQHCETLLRNAHSGVHAIDECRAELWHDRDDKR